MLLALPYWLYMFTGARLASGATMNTNKILLSFMNTTLEFSVKGRLTDMNHL